MKEAPAQPAVVPASRVAGVKAYATPPQRFPTDLRLDANEGPSLAAEAFAAVVGLTPERLSRYSRPTGLEAMLADEHGVDPARVVVTNGGDDAIDRVCRAVLEPGRRAVLHAPTFEMIPRSVALSGGDASDVPWFDGPFPIDAFCAAIDADAALVAVVTPNNPTGVSVPASQVARIVAAAAEVGAIAMIDHAYIEFADHDPTLSFLGHDNVVVIRTFSKAFGLAGARVGYAIASEEVAGWLRAVGGPFPVSASSQALAEAALRLVSSGAVRSAIARIRSEREELTRVLQDAGATVPPSQANFVLARLPAARLFRDALAAQGIAVRGFAEQSGLADSVRITLPGDAEVYRRLMRAVSRALTVRSEQELEGLLP